MNHESFDYVIVGAGSAGCVLAARLSENEHCRVLLLEAGGSDANPLVSIPIGMGKLHQHRLHDWRFETEPEPNLDGRRLEAARGKVLGGSSSINVMAYTRGNSADFERWSREGASGWSYRDVLPYFKKGEAWESGENPWRGGSGPVGTQFGKTQDPIFPAWIEAGAQAGFPTVADYNGAQQEGFGRGQYTIRDGRRSSSSRAYLRPARARKNLVVRTRAHVCKVLFEGVRATGVRYLRGGKTNNAYAAREVILCAGAFSTPHLLMLSGIGPADDLRQTGIDPLLDHPNVGAHLQDHLGVWIVWSRRSPGSFHAAMRADRMALSMLRAYFLGSGAGTVVPGGLHAFIKTRADLEVPDIEFMFHTVPAQTRLWFPVLAPPYQDGYAIRPTLLHPQSRGRISLRSSDPLQPMRITYRFFTDARDLPHLREGFLRAREVGAQHAMEPFRGKEIAPGEAVRNPAEIDAFIRRTASTAHHPCSTCRMGSDPQTSVLDPQLRVRGTQALRVVDASAMPDLVSAHINACVLMMGEKAAAMIRGEASESVGGLAPAHGAA